mmetsp:Transcript_21501/g.23995  ORF Transcript_21501/g.23995 Transcript_21501/m.23995 type:complete len:495 (+) Transcript_21501:56-1540(+)
MSKKTANGKPTLTPRKKPVKKTKDNYDTPLVERYGSQGKGKDAMEEDNAQSWPSITDPVRLVLFSLAWVLQQLYMSLWGLWGVIAIVEVWSLSNSRKYLGSLAKTLIGVLFLFALYLVFVGITNDFNPASGMFGGSSQNVTIPNLQGDGAKEVQQYVDSVRKSLTRELKKSVTELKMSSNKDKNDISTLTSKVVQLRQQMNNLQTKLTGAQAVEYSSQIKSLKSQMDSLTTRTQAAEASLKNKMDSSAVERAVKSHMSASTLTNAQTSRIVNAVLAKIKADPSGKVDEAKIAKVVDDYINGDHGVQRVDYAMMGSASASYVSPDHGVLDTVFSYLTGASALAEPSEVLSKEIWPANCWAFDGQKANLTISLHCPIVVDSFSIDHIPASVSPTGRRAAPKAFEVWGQTLTRKCRKDKDGKNEDKGCVETTSRMVPLGVHSYDQSGATTQMFELKNKEAFSHVVFRFKENYGHRYTCIYRVRVHGETSRYCDVMYE